MKGLAILTLLIAQVVKAEASDSLTVAKVSVGGFVDVYYAYDFAKPPSGDRGFTTQPLRHNEFNLNLALVDVKYAAENVRGRFALQTGTYVQSNYATEPSLLKNIHEANAGFRPGGSWWLNLGIFASHIGLESAVSKDNWTYSRSLMAEYSPYYEAGFKLSGALSDKITLGMFVLNGWQNIRETNSDKAIGTQFQFKPNNAVVLNWSTFLGNEAPDTVSSQMRIFNHVYGLVSLKNSFDAAVAIDVGLQKRPLKSTYASWYAVTLLARYAVSPTVRVGARVEYYADKEQIIVATGTPNGFQTFGASVNVDYAASENFLFRVEARQFRSKDDVYPSAKGLRRDDGFITTSFAVSF